MKKIYNSITEMVGHTPLLRLHKLEHKHHVKANILGKCEFYNPLFSSKDRVALKMLEQAEKQGLSKDSVFVEATSGNTGIALAALCAAKNYKLVIIMPENITTIGDKAFYNFPSLNEIYFKSIAPPTDLGENMFLGCSPHIIIYYPAGFEYSWGPTWLGFKTQPWGTFEEATIKILKIETNHETGEINLTLIFTGILEESTDGISWLKMTEVQSPYTVTIKKNQNRLFRSKFKWSASLSNSN